MLDYASRGLPGLQSAQIDQGSVIRKDPLKWLEGVARGEYPLFTAAIPQGGPNVMWASGGLLRSRSWSALELEPPGGTPLAPWGFQRSHWPWWAHAALPIGSCSGSGSGTGSGTGGMYTCSPAKQTASIPSGPCKNSAACHSSAPQ